MVGNRGGDESEMGRIEGGEDGSPGNEDEAFDGEEIGLDDHTRDGSLLELAQMRDIGLGGGPITPAAMGDSGEGKGDGERRDRKRKEGETSP